MKVRTFNQAWKSNFTNLDTAQNLQTLINLTSIHKKWRVTTWRAI